MCIGQPKLRRQSNKKKKSLARSLRNLFEEEKQIEDKMTEGTAEENCENVVSLLKHKSGCLSAKESGRTRMNASRRTRGG